ncbi:MAG: thioredoxin domain-containing protein [Candidatus Bathyarchaeia archaeon]
MSIVSEVDVNNWEREVLKSDVLTIVDFWHTNCPWCLRLNPIFDEVAEEHKDKAKFVKMNVLKTPENRELAISLGIMSTPTLVFFCNGRPVGATVGFVTKEQLKHIIDDILARHKECIKQSTELKLDN